MFSTPALILAILLVLARSTSSQEAAQESSATKTTTPTPTNWTSSLQKSIAAWKEIIGYHGKTTIELQKRGYPLEIIEPYAQEGLGVAEKCLEKSMANYSSPKLTTAIKKHWKDALALFPNDDWNVKLVDNMVAEFEKFYPKPNDETESNDRAHNVLVGLVYSMKVINCWVTHVKKSMMKPEISGDDGLLFNCTNRIFQGIVRGFYGPCTDAIPTAEASVDSSLCYAPSAHATLYVAPPAPPPKVDIWWAMCLEGCAEKFENNKV